MKRILEVWFSPNGFSTLMAAGLISVSMFTACAHRSAEKQTATLPIFAEVKTRDQARSAILNWDDRIFDLKKEATATLSKDHFSDLKKKISKLESELNDVKEDYLDLRLAEAGKQQKHLNDINRDLNDMVNIYGPSHAE